MKKLNNCNRKKSKSLTFFFSLFLLGFLGTLHSQTNPCFDVQSSGITAASGCGGGSITLTATNFVLPIRYKVYKINESAPADWTTATDPTFSIQNLCGGTYKIKVDDGSTCPTVCPVITINGPLCLEVDIEFECFWERQGCSGSWTVDAVASGGTEPYTYRWTNEEDNTISVSNRSRLNASQTGTYRVTVTDANGCIATDLVYLGPLEIIPTIIDADCNNNLGEINIRTKGGMLDCNMCQIPIMTLELLRVDPQTGEFLDWEEESLPEVDPDFTSLGVNTFNWTSTQPERYFAFTDEEFSITKLAPGKYKLRVADALCEPTLEFEIKMKQIEITTSITEINCTDPNSGNISITATGGEEPYTYEWKKNGIVMSGVTGTEASNLSAGTYTVTVIGDDGCSSTETITLNPILDANSIEFDEQYCFNLQGQQRVKISVKQPISTGTGPYTYTWPGPLISGFHQYNATPGETFDLTITDSRGCSVTINIEAEICTGGAGEVFPNPTSGQFTARVTVTGAPHEIDLRVTNNLQTTIFFEDKGVLQPGIYDFPIDISGQPSGTYYLSVAGGGSINIIKQ